MSKAPEFSIVVPVYNACTIEPLFRSCLESILNQDFAGLELILVDDCSTDESRALLNEFARRDKRVHAHFLESKHYIGTARNTGTDLAQGDYVLYVDFDDYLYPDALSSLHRLVAYYDRPDIVQFGHRNLVCENPTLEWLAAQRRRPLLHKPRLLDRTQALSKFLCGRLAWPPWVRIIRTDLARQVRFPDIWAEDLPHALGLFQQARTVLHSRQQLYAHLVRPRSNETSCQGAEHFQAQVVLCRHLDKIIHDQGLNEKFPTQSQRFRTSRFLDALKSMTAFDYTADDARIWCDLVAKHTPTLPWLVRLMPRTVLNRSMRERRRLHAGLRDFKRYL
ncbi:MAG: glycosyltransferase [Gammaproteobacteria bacterium]|nr:glycosyltransferase [Gammaproteobacteria bacterium]